MMNWNTLAAIVLVIGILSCAIVKNTGATEKGKQQRQKQMKEQKGRS